MIAVIQAARFTEVFISSFKFIFMKKHLLVLLLLAMGVAIPRSKAAIVIFNNMPCDVTVALYCHDGNYPGLCDLFKATRITVPGGGSWGPYTVNNLNPDWYLPQPYPNLPININPAGQVTPTQFDAAIVSYAGGAFGGMVGNPAGCATNWSVSTPNPVGSGTCWAPACTILWQPIGANIILSIDPV